MVQKLTLSQACEGMIRYKMATGRSRHTIADYRVSFKKLMLFFDSDAPIASITRKEMVPFFAWLQDEYVSNPDGAAPRGEKRLSPKSIRNVHTNLSALWTWADQEGFVEENIISTIEKPKANPPIIEPFTKDDVVLLVKACDISRTWKSRRDVANIRPTADRDRAIILTLLDTGVRASELCGIQFGDVNLTTHNIKIQGKGPGQGSKERMVYFGKRTGNAIWKCLVPRLDGIQDDDPLIVVGKDDDWRPMSRHVLGRLLKTLFKRTHVEGVYPHRFRHTFAITYLRNDGDVFTLQALLGHSDLTMVKRYARIAQIDCATTHRKASPVDNWRL
jgi:integrase/recombinase XerD